MEKSVAKTLVLVILVVILAATVGAYYIEQKEQTPNKNALNPSPTPTPNPSISPTPTLSTSPTPAATISPSNANPLTIISVSIIQPVNPGGPTIEITLQNNSTNAVTSLQAILRLSGNNYTYVFDNVSKSTPLLPNQNVSQTSTLIGAGFETNQEYPIEIMGTLQDGTPFNFITPVTIPQSPNQLIASGTNGNLQLTITLNKTTYSLGEPINFTLTITNISGQTINFTHTGLDYDFRVTNDTNNLVYQYSNFLAIPQYVFIQPLPAGASMSANFSWLQICNFNTAVQGEPVSPGTYNLIGLTGPIYGIETTPIEITIIEP